LRTKRYLRGFSFNGGLAASCLVATAFGQAPPAPRLPVDPYLGVNIRWVAGQQISEYVCDNNRDLEHLVGN
jgi:hypothetical protein